MHVYGTVVVLDALDAVLSLKSVDLLPSLAMESVDPGGKSISGV